MTVYATLITAVAILSFLSAFYFYYRNRLAGYTFDALHKAA